ncbi:MAG: phosphatidylglycerol lysyltransferase domain-containing protein, partial [Lachnospiraceae bacterium]|nr:phosphatidylglycerol lysyltransferase domain-containing protein [Lachnospiraceae bacterium]
SEQGEVRLSYPIGAETEGEERQIFEQELEYFKEIGQKPLFGLIDPVMWERINRWYPERFHLEYERDWADYIYSREKLTTLAGKKLHGKRNHIKRFIDAHPEWSYERITEENVEECAAMAKNWCRANCIQEDEEKEEEFHLVIRALRNFKALHMTGGLLRTGEGVVAFTLGSPVSADTFDVSFEKAYGEIQGAYPMINQQFVMHELQNYTYINREEDVGVEGLRKAKLSYYPEILLEKGILRELY